MFLGIFYMYSSSSVVVEVLSEVPSHGLPVAKGGRTYRKP
jgi:hypothetical protein